MATWNNLGYTAKDRNPMYQTGKKLLTVHAQAPIDVSEVANGDVWVLAQVSLTSRVHRLVVGKAFACAAATDNDFGFYRKVNGVLVAIDNDILVDGIDFTSGSGSGLVAGYDILSANTSLDRTKNVGELLNVSTDDGYAEIYLCMTMNTKETTTDLVIDLDVVIEESTTN